MQNIDKSTGQSNVPNMMLAGGVALGLLFGCSTLGWNQDGTIYGMSVQAGLPYRFCLQAMLGLTFVVIACVKNLFDVKRTGFWALMGCLVVAIGVACSQLGIGLNIAGAAGLYLGGALTSIGRGIFMYAWLRLFRCNVIDLFVMLACESGVAYLFCLEGSIYGGALLIVLPYVLVAGAYAVFCIALRFKDQNMSLPSDSVFVTSDSIPLDKHSFMRMAGCLLLCGIANGFSWFSTSGSTITLCCTIVCVSFICAALLRLVKIPHENLLFASIAMATCVLIVCRFVLPQGQQWLVELTYMGFWLLHLYSIAWFDWHGAAHTANKPAFDMLGIGLLYVINAVSTAAIPLITQDVACIIALALTALAFAIAFVNAGFSAPIQSSGTSDTAAPAASDNLSQEPFADSLAQNPIEAPFGQANRSPLRSDSVFNSRIETLAASAQLTDAEKGIFELLAKGYSLRQVAKASYISENTAKYHRHNIYQKLGVSSRQELINLVEHSEENPKMG